MIFSEAHWARPLQSSGLSVISSRLLQNLVAFLVQLLKLSKNPLKTSMVRPVPEISHSLVLNSFLFYNCGKTPWLRQLAEGFIWAYVSGRIRACHHYGGEAWQQAARAPWTVILKLGAEIAHQRWRESAFRAAAMTMCRLGGSVLSSDFKMPSFYIINPCNSLCLASIPFYSFSCFRDLFTKLMFILDLGHNFSGE